MGADNGPIWKLNNPSLHHSIPQIGADGETRTPVGRIARQFTKLLLSLLSHAGRQVDGRWS